MSLMEEAKETTRAESDQQTIDRLSRRLADKESQTTKLAETVYQAVRDECKALTIRPVRPPKSDRRRRKPEVAVPVFSDLQLAKVTPSYDSSVAEQRVDLYASKIAELTEIARSDHPVKHCLVASVGDIIEGLLIFPGQHYLVDSSLYRQITVDGPRIVVQFLRQLLTVFETVEVHWVIGNHGRLGRRGEYDPETNGDRMLGRIVASLLEGEPRIRFVIPDGAGERHWYSVAELGNWRGLLLHGDQFRGGSFGGLPYYGFHKKVNGWAAGGIHESFSDVISGHYHQCAQIPVGKRTIYQNGTFESDNTYASEELATMGDPQQWLLFVDPAAGRVTTSYKVDLKES